MFSNRALHAHGNAVRCPATKHHQLRLLNSRNEQPWCSESHRCRQQHHVQPSVSCRSNGSESIGVQIQSTVDDVGDSCAIIDEAQVKTVFIAETLLPTRLGLFRLRGYKHSVDGGATLTEPTAILCGVVEGQENVPVRVHDACFTSEVLGSLKCDCAEQLELALSTIQANPPGMVIYLQQEGRGIGLANKIAAYALQEKGLDTVDANRALGLPDDCREYTSVRNILEDLNIRSIQLITNNPRKINLLTTLGINITGRIPCLVQAGSYNQGYLKAKETRMEHLLDGSWCYWNHDGEPKQPTSSAMLAGGMGLPGNINADLTGTHTVVHKTDKTETRNGDGKQCLS